MERVADLQIDAGMLSFFTDELLPATDISPETFWPGVSAIVHELSPVIRDLLERRDDLQRQIDGWHRAHPGPIEDAAAYERFLRGIGYLLDEPADFPITTENVDTEIARQAGPQLVVPLTNARFAANAANARWGSLYDALYGTDAIPRSGDLAPAAGYNPARGSAVIAAGRELLDIAAPLGSGSHADSTRYAIGAQGLEVTLADGTVTSPADPAAFVGYRGDPADPSGVLLVHNGLHLEIAIDRDDPVGATDPAGVRDLVLEAAITTIMDLEDSIAAVDAEDKIVAYRTWLLLMQGRLTVEVTKGGSTFTRVLEPDRDYVRPDGSPLTLPGRSQLFVRHVGHFMQTDALLDRDGLQIPEGILDALVTALAAVPSLRGDADLSNSRTGSIYVVKPKLHGPEEVAATVRLFAAVERLLGLPERTIKIGIMDEERRTTLNLKASIYEARDRVVFINTGFLDRTGDEIHTSMLAGPVLRKGDLRTHPYIGAYEDQNVDVGLAAGFAGRAQIGKGMWAMPDLMAAMLEQKIAQPRAGATTAWVPSPTAATLHATHYHRADVAAVQAELRDRVHRGIAPILDVPVVAEAAWTADERRAELDSNVQSILGYVVRWVDQGIGCSKVLDINDVGLMEDRATLRISSQLLGNWLLHGVITREEVQASLERLSATVDRQNADDPEYRSLLDGSSLAFQAARDLILEATAQPNGYTEPILHSYRRLRKAQTA